MDRFEPGRTSRLAQYGTGQGSFTQRALEKKDPRRKGASHPICLPSMKKAIKANEEQTRLGLLTSDWRVIGMMVAIRVFSILLGLVGAIVSWIKLRPSYAAWITGNWLFCTSLEFILGVPRYTLVMFPIFIHFAQLASRFIWRVIIAVWSLMFLALFAAQFVRGRWAF